MNGILCTLSAKRRKQLEEDPDLVEDIVDAAGETEIPGLLDLGKTWDALDWIVSSGGADKILGDAVLARSGKEIGPPITQGPARLLTPERVRQIAAALAALPADHVRVRFPTLKGRTVHGKYGQTQCDPDDFEVIQKRVRDTCEREIDELTKKFEAIRALYAKAAQKEEGLFAVVV